MTYRLIFLIGVLLPSVVSAADPLCRVFSKADGSVVVTCLPPSTTKPSEAFAEAVQAMPSLKGLPYVDVPQSQLPADPSTFHAWRQKGGKVVVDGTVPPPPKSKAQLRKEACDKLRQDATVPGALQEFCATY